jgi:hypothetical protein
MGAMDCADLELRVEDVLLLLLYSSHIKKDCKGYADTTNTQSGSICDVIDEKLNQREKKREKELFTLCDRGSCDRLADQLQ